MRQLVFSDQNLCVGCNRCVRNCPNEMANIAEQDSNNTVKVNIAADKCIACGSCIKACQHGARTYEDDTERFFTDLARGNEMSVMIAPAIRANQSDIGRLVAWLKQIGVKKVYDVSLGADICIWGYVRYMQKHPNAHIITQPCPAIVNYITMYRPNLIRFLSPVQSPMMCAAVLMRKYENINMPIAAISPCIAKSHEFEATGLINYNVTFEKLFKYITEKNIRLPDNAADFDHYKCGAGSIFSTPGGLKENLEFFLGKKLRIDRAEGIDNLYKLLDDYEKQPLQNLPDVFDVLNCEDGCNIGPASGNKNSFFTINRAMEQAREAALAGRAPGYFENLYKKYDETFKLEHFMRTYTPVPVNVPRITDVEIEKAFLSMDKTTETQRKFDCCACGSDTCYGMARRIVLKSNIPANCLTNSRIKSQAGKKVLEDLHKINIENSAKIEDDMERIKDSVQKIVENIGTVNKSITGFNTVERTINDITSMISMIAINASIEASRSGQAGKAFGVIASEIQNLAKSAQQTLNQSHNVFTDASNSVGHMNEIMGKILELVSVAHENIQEINRANAVNDVALKSKT